MVATKREDGTKMESVLLDTAHGPCRVEPKAVVNVLKGAAQSQLAHATLFIVNPLEDVTSSSSTTNVDVPV